MSICDQIALLGVSGAWYNLFSSYVNLTVTGPTGPSITITGTGPTGATGVQSTGATGPIGEIGQTGPTGLIAPNVNMIYGEIASASGSVVSTSYVLIGGMTGISLNGTSLIGTTGLSIPVGGLYDVQLMASGAITSGVGTTTNYSSALFINGVQGPTGVSSVFSNGANNCVSVYLNTLQNLPNNSFLDARGSVASSTFTVMNVRLVAIGLFALTGSTGATGLTGATGIAGYSLNTGPTGVTGGGITGPTGRPYYLSNTGPGIMQTLSGTGAATNVVGPVTSVNMQLKGVTGMNVSTVSNRLVINGAVYGVTGVGSHSNTGGTVSSRVAFGQTLTVPSVVAKVVGTTGTFGERYGNIYLTGVTGTGFTGNVMLANNYVATVDGATLNSTPFISMCLMYDNCPAIAYYTSTNTLAFVKNFQVDGKGYWKNYTFGNAVDSSVGAGKYCSLRMLSDGSPGISYYDSNVSNLNLKFARNVALDGSGGWATQAVDSTGDRGQFSSLCVLSDGSVAISYFDNTLGDLRFARNNSATGSSTWVTSIVDSTGTIGQYSNLIQLANNLPAIAYYDATNLDLRFAVNDSATGAGQWYYSTVDSVGDAGTHLSMAILGDSTPGISYYNSTDNVLRFAKNSNIDGLGTWSTTTVDSSGGQYTSLMILKDGTPGIAYYGVTGQNLKFARNDSIYVDGTWNIQTIVTAGNVGENNSTVLMANGLPAIAYQDVTGSDLNFIASGLETKFVEDTTYSINYIVSNT